MPPHMKPSTPSLKLGSILRLGGYLIASVHTGLDDYQFVSFRREIVDEVSRRETRGVVIDLAAVDVLDSFACMAVRQTTQMVGLRGAESVVVGVAPDVAFAMVKLGVDLGTARTAADVDEGLHMLQLQLSPSRPGSTLPCQIRTDDLDVSFAGPQGTSSVGPSHRPMSSTPAHIH